MGLQKGADAYMAKPFNREELLVRMEQLILLRKQLQARFGSSKKKKPLVDKQKLRITKFAIEDKFIAQVNQIITTNLEREDFDLNELCKALGMSASQLYRKLKAITGKSTAIYIRFIRLEKAKDLLHTTDKNVSEIAYEVGFKELAYFSRCFSEEYGISPSQIRK